MIQKSILFAFYFLSLQILVASSAPKILKAIRISESIKIDGNLAEPCWNQKEKAKDFVQLEPTPGVKASFDTEVYFMYDNNAIYIGAKLFDPEPNKILKELSLRDQTANAESFTIFLDTYKSGINGFLFEVTASGVQYDAVVSDNEDDSNWNAVWESAVKIDDRGWNVEIKIPYSSLRFPSEVVQDWHVQFGREIRRFRESVYWNPIDPLINGWVQQSGKITQIENIKSPVRLSLTPYLSGYVNSNYDPNRTGNKFSTSTAYSAGLDLKYGINDAFTLDMTLVPDFGQVISDKQVLNLTPFEVFFPENRPFFTEGTELFNKGNLFYSRRIGDQPLHYYDVNDQLKEGEVITDNPETSQLINATKVTGRTQKGTGIGIFNAIVGETFATIRDANQLDRKIKTNPTTNYNALVIDQNLKNNSFVSFINTNVTRFGQDYDANVTGSFFNLKTKDQKYFVSGSGVMSRKIYSDDNSNGYTYNISLGKGSGNWTYDFGHGLESDKYDPNDMGFLYSPNEKYYYLSGAYSQYKPKRQKWQQYSISGTTVYSRLYKPDVFTDYFISFNSFLLLKSRFAFGINTRIEPIVTHDYFEPRLPDFSKYVRFPTNYTISGFVSSDYRKPFAYDLNLSYRTFDIEKRKTWVTSINPRFRLSDKISILPSTSLSYLIAEPGYVNRSFVDVSIPNFDANDILMGVRNRTIVENTLSGKYSFSSKMGINLRIRHYWDQVRYQSFGKLGNLGNVESLAYSGKDKNGIDVFDRNINIFNVDLQYNWRFAPGSDIIFVWKNQIFNSDTAYDKDYLQNLGGLFGSDQSNSVSLRILYYLDYLYLFPRKA